MGWDFYDVFVFYSTDVDGGLAKFDGTNWTYYNIYRLTSNSNDVRAIAIDEGGILWIGTVSDYYYSYHWRSCKV
jgi:hypothetical protein